MARKENVINLSEYKDRDINYIKDKEHEEPIQEIQLTEASERIKEKMARKKLSRG
jgi:hypothetical protein